MPSEDVIAVLRVEGTSQFTQQMGQARGATEQTSEAAAQTGEDVGRGAKGWVQAAAGVAIAVKGYGMLKGAVDNTVQLSKATSAFSRASGMSRQESQNWVVIAQKRGIETKQLQMGMATLGRNLNAVGKDGKTSSKAFQALGLEQQKLIGMPMQERMSAISDAFSKMADGPEKAAAAQQLFGRSGQQLLPVLNEGGQALTDQLDAANRLVPALGGTGDQAMELAKKQREAGMAMDGLKIAIASALLPVLSTLAGAVAPIIGFVAQLMNRFKPLTYVVLTLGAALVGLLIFNKVMAMFKAAKAAIAGLKVAWAALNIVMAANPMILVALAIVALIAGLVLLYMKCAWFRDAVNAVWEAIKSAFMAVVNFIRDNWRLMVLALVVILFGPIAGVIALFFLMRDKFDAAVNAIKVAARAAWNFIRSTAQAVVGAVGGFFAGLGNRIAGAFNAAKAAAVGALKSIATFARDRVNDIVNFFKGLPAKIGGALSGLGGIIGSALSSGVKAALNSVISIINSFIAGTNKVIGGLNKVPGVNIGNIGTIGHLAQGTANWGGGLAIVGERGPELVALPQGTAVTPMSAPTPVAATGTDRPIVTQVFLERRMIAEAIGSFASELQAAR